MNVGLIRNKLIAELNELFEKQRQTEGLINFYEENKMFLDQNVVPKEVYRYLENKYQLYLSKKDLEKIKKVFYEDYNITLLSLRVLNQKIAKYKETIKNISYKHFVPEETMLFIKEYMVQNNYSDMDIITIMEKIKHANSILDPRGRFNYNDINTVYNILHQGFEDFNLKSIADEGLNRNITNIINMLKVSFTHVVENGFDLDFYNQNQIKYMYGKVLEYFQNEQFDLIQMVKDKDFYFDKETLDSIIADIRKCNEIYNFMREKYDALEFNYEPVENQELPESGTQVELYYSNNTTEPLRCFFIKDLEDIRDDSLGIVRKLINEFKSGDFKNFKPLSGNKGAYELKDDQVRIVLKHIANNAYSVMGIFIKKKDNDRHSYIKMTERPIAETNKEVSKIIEDYYEEYINNNMRAYSR